MTVRTLTHLSDGPVALDVSSDTADIDVAPSATGHATVTIATHTRDGRAQRAVETALILESPGRIVVRLGDAGCAAAHIRVTAELPSGSSLDVLGTSGRVTTAGVVDEAYVRTDSGSIRIGEAATATLRTGSGSIAVGSAETLEADTDSGFIEIGAVGTVTARTGSGAITVTDVRGPAQLTTICGRIEVGYSGPIRPVTQTVAGSVTVVQRVEYVQDSHPEDRAAPVDADGGCGDRREPGPAGPGSGARRRGWLRPGPTTPAR